MSETLAPNQKQPRTTTAKIIYILYLVGLFIGLTAIIGVVMAYINRSDAPAWLASHYRFQIRTFWIGLLYLLLGSILAAVVVGWLLVIFWMVWLIVRCAQGLKYLGRREAHPNPTTWWFS